MRSVIPPDVLREMAIKKEKTERRGRNPLRIDKPPLENLERNRKYREAQDLADQEGNAKEAIKPPISRLRRTIRIRIHNDSD